MPPRCRGGLRCSEADQSKHVRTQARLLRPTVRGHDGGRLLVEAMLDQARSFGYQRMCLDVLLEFETAQRLYETLGFTDAPALAYNPVPGTRFMALML
ncbi:MAG: GNAT family N-acetyltransferase [Limnohabitans sp.]